MSGDLDEILPGKRFRRNERGDQGLIENLISV